jgi:AcrR family transcriptional regulator
MPTGVALHDARAQLLKAGEHVLLRDGPAGVTSRAITDEAGVAKGVLHRHFVDFDDFLLALTQNQIAATARVTIELIDHAGSGTLVGNLASALSELFNPLGLALIRLVFARDELRARLRGGTPQGVPFLAEAVTGISAYLVAEQHSGRILATAQPDALAYALVGTGHLLFAGELGGLPDESAVREIVEAITVGAETS